MQAHEQRVVDEEQELNDRLTKLSQFLKSDFFQTLDEENKGLLIKQEKAMTEYSHILAQRISLFK